MKLFCIIRYRGKIFCVPAILIKMQFAVARKKNITGLPVVEPSCRMHGT